MTAKTPEAKARALARSRAWKAANRDRVRTSRRAYRLANSEKEAAHRREWVKRNPDMAKRLADNHKPYIRDWQALRKSERTGMPAMFVPGQVRDDYCGACWACGSTNATGMDHVVPLKRSGSNFAFNVRLLCSQCNLRKHARMDYEVRDAEFRARLLLGHEAFTACFGRAAS